MEGWISFSTKDPEKKMQSHPGSRRYRKEPMETQGWRAGRGQPGAQEGPEV